MSIKLNNKYVDNYFEEKDWILLEPYPSNNKIKMECLCQNGHLNHKSFNSFQKKSVCSKCVGYIRYTYNDVKEYIETVNYKLLSSEYKSSQEKLIIQCPNDHIYEVTFDNFKNSKSRCMKCVKKELGLKYNHKFNYVKQYIEANNYKLLSDEYINSNIKLKIKCPKGHIYDVTFNGFKKGNRCKKCHLNNINKKMLNNKQIDLNKKLRITRNKNWIIKNMKDDPNYNNFLLNPKEYVLDHIIPIKAFQEYIKQNNIKNINKFKKISNLRINLQLLLREENSNKYDRFNNEIFLEYIKENYKETILC